MNLTIDINNKTEIRNAITLLESLLPKPAAKVVTKAVKKTTKKVVAQKLPPGIPNPPSGFMFVGKGPIAGSDGNVNRNIAAFGSDGKWDATGWVGNFKTIYYAVKKGSKIAKLNGL